MFPLDFPADQKLWQRSSSFSVKFFLISNNLALIWKYEKIRHWVTKCRRIDFSWGGAQLNRLIGYEHQTLLKICPNSLKLFEEPEQKSFDVKDRNESVGRKKLGNVTYSSIVSFALAKLCEPDDAEWFGVVEINKLLMSSDVKLLAWLLTAWPPLAVWSLLDVRSSIQPNKWTWTWSQVEGFQSVCCWRPILTQKLSSLQDRQET